MSRILRHTFVVLCAALLLAAVPAAAGEFEHIVQNGDTVYSLARRYGVKAEEILFLNGIEDARKIKVGQKLRVPSASIMAEPISGGAPPAFVMHTAVNGDTLYGLARNYGISYQALLAANNFPPNKLLKIGERVKVPLPAPAAAPPAGAEKQLPPDKRALPSDKRAVPLAGAPQTGGQQTGGAQPRPAQPAARVPQTGVPSNQAAKLAARRVDTRLKWPVAVKEAAYMTGKLDGVVLTAEKSAPVQSLSSGTVASAGPYRGFGRVAIIQSDTGYIYVYGGCESLSVRAGERVVSGTELGRLGVDAVSQKPQLFFMVYNGNTAIDPAKAPRA
ncbi:MAG: LysM peptidoglycan-binding domain-containing M23 family metallopeptidase [Spirochaetaceae bacterium]|jgi:murein DD-endopeptidase MepM/ murein hydrolase activator NlpD|nr:LysM peptidoglycan-binding domain-containing M23 family metallopeptidase [Spirochaetaceae bacterium]